MCQENGFDELEYIDETQFYILDISFLPGGCSQNEPFNQTQSGLYQIFWGNLFDEIINYTSVVDGQSSSLIMSRSNNDRAVYGNGLLSITNFNRHSFSISPNPVEDLIHIQKKNEMKISKIRIFNLNRKLIHFEEHIVPDNMTINVQNLNKGIYFISLENEDNQMLFLKFIKT